ncbi:MAG: GDP-mannose 4,6-dehydratase [Candidatus Omnitrophica bacterium]|nr:GDP-mannose 4,6-dehydratase [Candidatus Omnitrophota bacterium]
MKKILITGGAGFIGTNLALRLLQDKKNVVIILDNLSRAGSEINLKFLLSRNFENLKFINGDIRDYRLLRKVTKGIDCVFHLAAQVAVTSSIKNPVEDFEINAMGTLYLLEACRKNVKDALFLYASTNKVYGSLSHLKVRQLKTRYTLVDRIGGIDESETLDFHSPYGCSKGAGDQYVRDFSRIYNMNTVVFRQSCIYGQYQHGNVDQGWVVHFVKKALDGKKITIYGDGKQVRDILHVDDLIDAYLKILENKDRCAGKIFNVGGGMKNTFSLLELIDYLEYLLGRKIEYRFESWRPGDQKVFISNNKRLEMLIDWRPKINKQEGIKRLVEWVKENR